MPKKMSDEELKGMPAALRRQVRAEEAAEARAEQQSPPPPPPEPPEPPASEPPSAPDAEQQEQAAQEPAEQTTPSPESEAVTKADLDKLTAEMKKELADERQRFKTLQGKYNAEIPRLQTERDELRRRLDDFAERRQQEPEQPVLPGHLRHLDDEERETLKSEPLPPEVRQAKGIAEDIVSPLRLEINGLKREIESLRGERTQEKHQSRAERLWDAVEKRLPGARQINEQDDGFREYLNLPDPDNADGMPFASTGAAALDNGDVATIVRIISSYAKSRGNGEGESAPVPPVKPSESRSSAPSRKQTLPPVRESEIGKWDHLLVTKGPDEDRVADYLTRTTGKPWTAKDVTNRTKELSDAMRDGRVIRG